jgi:MSV199 domain
MMWLGFTVKQKAKDVLTRHFSVDQHYKVLLASAVERNSHDNDPGERRGGHNKETILMNVRTFKKLCLKANTKKASEIHDYYIKMEETLHQYIVKTLEHQQKIVKEQTLIEDFHKKAVNYFGVINEEIVGLLLGKFGYTNDVNTRTRDHKREIVIPCDKNIALEKKFKEHPEITARRITKNINGKVQGWDLLERILTFYR